MAVTLAQATVATRACTDSGTMPQATVTTGPGDTILILEAVGRPVSWQSAWQIDGGPALTPLASYDEGGDAHLRAYAVTGLAAGSHTIDATNPASGGGTRFVSHAILVASGADPAGLVAGAVHADISGGTAATKTWHTGPVAAGGAAIGLQASRRDAAPAAVDHTNLGTSYLAGSIQAYASAALQSAAGPLADETMSVTFGGTGAGAYIAITLAPATGGTTKTAAASIALDLAPAGAASKAASAGAALALDLATGSDPAKTSAAAAILGVLLGLDSPATKHASTAASLGVLLGLDTTAAKTAAAAAGINLDLQLAAAAGLPPEHRTAAATLGLTLALDALAGKAAIAGTALGLTLATHGDATKTGVAHVDLSLILDTLAAAHKTGGAQAVLDLALAIAAAHYTPAGLTPPERTVRIAADDRTITITAQDRTVQVSRQDRTITIQEA